MNDNIIYNQNVICLFTESFENIKKKYDSDLFNWTNYEKIFNYLYLKLSSENINISNFTKYYYIFTFIYLNYTNYLVYINHKDSLN